MVCGGREGDGKEGKWEKTRGGRWKGKQEVIHFVLVMRMNSPGLSACVCVHRHRRRLSWVWGQKPLNFRNLTAVGWKRKEVDKERKGRKEILIRFNVSDNRALCNHTG